ncbi:protein STU1-like [Tripterygium wilfordii]|uniref:Protein STU1-like n=1 Tax=Tripterygium wilfordii TaxID=458696 RepID=A0A7J7DYX2_TRIWF|nr:protein STU1-like [Tripterygium wilfordii]
MLSPAEVRFHFTITIYGIFCAIINGSIKPEGVCTSATTSGPQPPKQSFARHYKFHWPILLTVNIAVGGYLFTRTKKKELAVLRKKFQKMFLQIQLLRRQGCEPIPEDKQRELFKWTLEEKRKVKPKDPAKKKLIDEEETTLKQFIHAKAIPSIW